MAVDYALSWGLPAIESRVTELADYLRQQLSAVGGIQVHDQGARQCGIVSFTIDGVPCEDVRRHVASRGVNVSVSVADYARLDMPTRGLTDLVRASVHYYNTSDEIDRLIQALPPAS